MTVVRSCYFLWVLWNVVMSVSASSDNRTG